METKKCESCGRTLPASDFSKSYRNRCKECVAQLTREKRAAQAINSTLNGVIIHGKVYEVEEYCSTDDCDICDLDIAECKGICSGFGVMTVFRYSKELTDKIIKK